MTAFDRDDLIRIALTPADTVHAPADLADDIERAVATTPQRRSLIPWFAVARWIPSPSPALLLAGLVALLLLVGALFVLANRQPPTPPGLTIYHGGPARTGVLPGPGPVGKPVVLWQGELRGPVQVTTMPVVIDDRVYIADGAGFVSAFDAATGDLVGEPVSLGSEVQGSPTIAQGALIVGADDGSLTALDLDDLSIRWHVALSPGQPIRSSLLTVADVIYVGSDDGNLYVVDAATGTTRQTIPIGAPIARGPALADGVIYVGTVGGLVAAIDQATGTVDWTQDFGPGDIGTPTVVGDALYIARGLHEPAGPHEVVALGVRDRVQRWSFGSPTGGEILAGAATIDHMFAVAKDGYVYDVDPANGASRWSTDTGSPIGAVASLVDGVLYVTNDGRQVIALDASTGKVRWQQLVEGAPTLAAVIDGRVFVATSLGKVVALGDPPSSSGAAP